MAILRQPLSSFFNSNGCRDISTLPSIFILWKNQQRNNGINSVFIDDHDDSMASTTIKIEALEKGSKVLTTFDKIHVDFVLGLASSACV